MKIEFKKKNFLFYILFVCLFAFFSWGAIKYGSAAFQKTEVISLADAEENGAFDIISHNMLDPLPMLALQIIIIVLFARFFGIMMNKIGQPSVVGEIIAGIVLGPSLLGLFFPDVFKFLFPPDSLPNLQILSEIGLILFMFIIGMELDVSLLKKNIKDAVIISHSGIVFPYFLGIILSLFLYEQFAPADTNFLAFALFLGISMSIAAFPVLARIIQERGLMKTELGAAIITVAAIDDVTAWSLLALVIAVVRAGDIASSLVSISLTILFVAFMIYVVNYILKRFVDKYYTRETINKTIMAIIFGFLFFSSYLTEVIGIHALFGAFMAGVIIPPKKEFRHVLTEKIEDIGVVLLLPLFFVFTGLRTQIGLLNDISLWLICLGIIGLAVFGKFTGVVFSSRFVGQSWKNSFIIGALLNTRGLMELIVLNIGYDLGVLSAEIFTMFVLLALFTTFMTGPALSVINKLSKIALLQKIKEKYDYKTLIAFGPPRFGVKLLKVAKILAPNSNLKTSITALHMTPNPDISINEAELFEKEGFQYVREFAEETGIKIDTIYRAKADISKEIVSEANLNYDLLLVGGSKSLFSEKETGGKVKYFFSEARCSVGVLIDRGIEELNSILFIISGEEDYFLVSYIDRVIKKDEVSLSIAKDQKLTLGIDSFRSEKKKLEIYSLNEIPYNNILKNFDLVVCSLNYWTALKDDKIEWLKDCPSILILDK